MCRSNHPRGDKSHTSVDLSSHLGSMADLSFDGIRKKRWGTKSVFDVAGFGISPHLTSPTPFLSRARITGTSFSPSASAFSSRVCGIVLVILLSVVARLLQVAHWAIFPTCKASSDRCRMECVVRYESSLRRNHLAAKDTLGNSKPSCVTAVRAKHKQPKCCEPA
jgi:hypothetical protein